MMNRYGFLEKKMQPWQLEFLQHEKKGGDDDRGDGKKGKKAKPKNKKKSRHKKKGSKMSPIKIAARQDLLMLK